MFRSVKKFAMSPTGKRVIAYVAPLFVGWVLSKLQGKETKTTKTTRRKK